MEGTGAAPRAAPPKPLPPCKTFYATGVCEDELCRGAKLHSDLALRVGLAQGATLKASMLAAAFSFFHPLAAVVTAHSEGVVIFGKPEDLQNAIAWQGVRICSFASQLPPATPLMPATPHTPTTPLATPLVSATPVPQASASAAASPDTREDAASAASPLLVVAPKAAVETPPVERAVEKPAVADVHVQRTAKSREWLKDGFEWEVNSGKKVVRANGTCRWNRECKEKGCRAVRTVEFDANCLVELDKTSPSHNHAPVRLNEALPSDGALWIATRVVVREGLTIKSLRCATPNCFARRRVKCSVVDGKLVSDESWGVHVHSPEERNAEANKEAVEETIARDRDEDIETLAMLRHAQPVRARLQPRDGHEWKTLGLPVVDDGREQRYQCKACEAVRIVRWNMQLEIESDETAPAHSHPAPVKGVLEGDNKAWEQIKLSVTSDFTERVYSCKQKGCAACRTVRWNSLGAVLSDATAGEHVHGEKKEEVPKQVRTKATGSLRWAPKRSDSYAWRVIKDIPLPSGRESVLVCVSASCPAVRTVRWEGNLKIASDVTEPRHSHLPPDPADAGEDSDAKKRICINWAPMVQDGFSWTKVRMTALPTGLETCFACNDCEAVRTVRWNLETLDVESDVTNQAHTHEVKPLPEAKKRLREGPEAAPVVSSKRKPRTMWKYKKSDGFAWTQVKQPVGTRGGGRTCSYRCGECPAMRMVEWDGSREIVSDVTRPDHTHAPRGAAGVKRSRAESTAVDGEGEQGAVPAAGNDEAGNENVEESAVVAEDEGPQKRAKPDVLELDEYRWTLQHQEDNCSMYKCVDCEAVRLVVVDADGQVLMDLTEPEHAHPPVPAADEKAAVAEEKPAEEKADENVFEEELSEDVPEEDGAVDASESKKDGSGKRARRKHWLFADRERPPSNAFAWDIAEDLRDKRVAVCRDCPAVRTVMWGAGLRVVADITEPPHTHALEENSLTKKRKQQRSEAAQKREALQSEEVVQKEDIVDVGLLPESECVRKLVEPEILASSSSQSSSGSLPQRRRADTKYKVPDDGHHWQFGTTKNKGSVVCKRMACGVVTCRAVRKLRYDVLRGNKLLSDRVVGRHKH